MSVFIYCSLHIWINWMSGGNMRQMINRMIEFKSLMAFMLTVAFLLCSCSDKQMNENRQDDAVSEESRKIRNFIEERYGIADNPVYGSCIVHKEIEAGTKTTTYEEKIKEDSKGGSVFYKIVNTEEQKDGLICAYLSDDGNHGIFLNADYILDKNNPSSGSHTVTLTTAVAKECCNIIVDYAIVRNDYFACVELSEEKNIADDDLIYSEKISVYKLTGHSLDELYTISRELESNTNELKNFEIKSDSEWIIYAAGYQSYTADGAEFVSTQQEFCNRANEFLKNSSLDCIVLNKTSWNNRWFGTSIDESGINDNMVKLDFSFSEPTVDENGDEVTDIVIKLNGEKQQFAQGEKLDEIEDYPVTYGQNTETITDEPIVMPENIPKSIDVNELQDLSYFSIDGFWHSSDYRYVYHIYTQHPDKGFGTFYFADLESGSKAKHGQVKQTSSYSAILKAMEDNEFSPEVYASNNQLISDDVTLVKADDWIASSLIGIWSDDSKTYTFDSDGTYEVKTSDDWYWGRYFIIDENQIVLGEHLDDLKVYNYILEENSLTLNECTFVRQ